MSSMEKIIPLAAPFWLLALVSNAQTCSIDWYKVAGGGASTGGAYPVRGANGIDSGKQMQQQGE